MKMGKKLLSTFLALAVALSCLIVPTTEAKAAYPAGYDADGLFFGTSQETYKSITVNKKGELVLGESSDLKVNKLRLVLSPDTEDGKYSKDACIEGWLTLDSYSDFEVVSVKTSNKNLKAIVEEHYTDKTYYTNGSAPRLYGSDQVWVDVLAKRPGKYTVKITVKLLPSGKVVTKAAQVKVVRKSPYEWICDESKLSGTDGTYDADSVKVSFRKSGLKNVKLYYSNKTHTYTEAQPTATTKYFYTTPTYKKFSSGKSIKLNNKTSYTYLSKQSTTSKRKTTRNSWYAGTQLLAIYKDSYYGTLNYTTTTIEKYRKLK